MGEYTNFVLSIPLKIVGGDYIDFNMLFNKLRYYDDVFRVLTVLSEKLFDSVKGIISIAEIKTYIDVLDCEVVGDRMFIIFKQSKYQSYGFEMLETEKVRQMIEVYKKDKDIEVFVYRTDDMNLSERVFL